MNDNREASLSNPSPVTSDWLQAFNEGRRVLMDYAEAVEHANLYVKNHPPTVIHTEADFDARAYNLPSHAEGLRMNDPVTLASLFAILTHANNCTGCAECLWDGN